jgi:STE24 endopeptidase
MKLFAIAMIGILILKLYLNFRQSATIKANINKVPTSFSQTISLAEHQKGAEYNLAKLQLDNLHLIFTTIVVLLFTLGGGIQVINNISAKLVNSNSLTYGVAIIAIFSIVNSILELPFSIYATFGIEEKFGFNKTTLKTFITDLIKSNILAIIIGLPLLYLVLWLMNIMGGFWWLWVWLVITSFSLLMLIIYPTFIAPLFNKFTLLDNPTLLERINNLLERTGFKSKGVYVMDGSKRSSHGNAYFTGIGNSKRIVFFDTLITKLAPEEVEAVLAHELGHFKLKHITKRIFLSFALTLAGLYVLSLLIHNPTMYHALGVKDINNANGLILFMLLVGIVTFPFAPLTSMLSRKHEFEADNFAKTHSDYTKLISGLVKLYRDNASTLTPDSLYVKFYYSHPPVSLRIQALEQSTKI